MTTDNQSAARAVWQDMTVPPALVQRAVEVARTIPDVDRRTEALKYVRRRHRRRSDLMTFIKRVSGKDYVDPNDHSPDNPDVHPLLPTREHVENSAGVVKYGKDDSTK